MYATLATILLAAAAEEGHGAAEHGNGGGMAFIKPEALTFLWTIIVFLSVLFILKRYAWKPLLKSLDEREGRIRKAIEDAERTQEAAHRLLKDHEERIVKIKDEADAIVAEARRDADVLRETVLKEAREEAERVSRRSRGEIELAKDRALEEIADKTSRLVAQVVSRYLRRNLRPEEQDTLATDCIEQYRDLAEKK